MDESSRGGYISIPETTIVPALKEALFDQQQLLQKLYGELDAEREATASAANETMSMILRLQEEKAAVMMEAKQYKRLAEEKMGHAEQTLEVLEELIYHKEMEVASLEFQVQAYRYKLMSLGWNNDDFGVAEGRFPEGFFPQRCNREMLSANNIARAISLPTMKGFFPNMEKLPSFKVEEYDDPDDIVEDELGNSGNVDSYWEQIQRLDERVKEISRDNLIVSFPPSPSTAREKNNVHFGEFKRDKDESVATSSTFRDVSVVPQSEETNGNHYKVKGRGKFVSFGENAVFGEKLDSKHHRERATRFQDHEKMSPRQKGENDNVVFGQSKHRQETSTCFQDHETVSPRQKGENDNVVFGEKPDLKHRRERSTSFQDHETVSPRQKGENDNVAFGFQQICTRIERLERNVMGREATHEGEEEIVLLKEIKDQLSCMQKDITLRKNRKNRPEDGAMITLMEALLHFW